MPKLCLQCGKPIVGRRPDAIFCSRSCYGKNLWQRNPELRARQEAARKKRREVRDYRKQEVRRDRATQRRRIETDPEYAALTIRRRRALKLRINFGITLDDYEQMLNAQDRACYICRSTVAVKGRPDAAFSVDHDHEPPYKIRALLCGECNTGLGKFRDDPGLLERAASYLRLHGK